MPLKTLNRLDFSNLSYKTGEQTLLNFFANYGRIEKLILYKDDQDQSLREGFVIYTELNSINQLMSKRPHSIDQRTVFLQRHIPSSLSSMKSSCMSDYLGAHLTVNEIFISRLCWGESRETFVNYFQRFGTIRHCRVFNTTSRNPKQMGYAFVSFDDYDSVDQVILSRPHVIHSRFYQVRKCIPREYNYIVSSIKPLSFNQPIWQHYAFGLINMHTQTITYPSRPNCVTRPTSLVESDHKTNAKEISLVSTVTKSPTNDFELITATSSLTSSISIVNSSCDDFTPLPSPLYSTAIAYSPTTDIL